MRRRDFIAGLSGAVLLGPRIAWAEDRVYHLATLHPALPVTEDDPYGKILVKTLAQYGYVIGGNLTFDARGAMGSNSRRAICSPSI
jgi:putative tryptophan/tyrosine transport system substrate-binding protein